ncbi:unnamed protein product [Effrenium voratum]|uniref:Uncharacterized protein n=1 Tax=Effrenium voratum TaxID=2562239 RepID=A0AA36J383_9DINO|nr:unnamed protein product [Effrenium voratum]CAJ1438365.1 unnamed protein product [Effrenium voratum]
MAPRWAYPALFYFLTATTLMSGVGGFLLKLKDFYRPDAYIVEGKPGTGTTPFEIIATYVFGLVYVVPQLGCIHAHFVERTRSARRSACVAPMAYHFMSVYGVLCVFEDGLNPIVAPKSAAAGMHLVFGLLFLLMYALARDDYAAVANDKKN